MGRIGPIIAQSVTPNLVSDLSYSGLAIPMTVASNAIGVGAVLRLDASGGLVPADTEAPAAPGLFIAVEAGTGQRRVLCWSGGIVRNDAWTFTPVRPLYLSAAPGELSHVAVGSPVGMAISSTTVYFGAIHSSYQEGIVLTHTGQTFAAIIDVDTVTYPSAEIVWSFADGTTDNTATPSKDFGTAAERQTTLRVTPWAALTLLDVGYVDDEDGSTLGVEYNLANQNVTNVSGLQSATGLVAFCASHNPLQALNVSGLASLETIECYQTAVMQSFNKAGCVSLKRVCLERGDLIAVDLSDVLALEDYRSAYQGQGGGNGGLKTLTLPAVENRGSIWHLCVWGNDFTTNPSLLGMTGLEELIMNNASLTGELVIEGGSLEYGWLYYNPDLTVLNVSGAFSTTYAGGGWLAVQHCGLTALDISSNPRLGRLEANDNNFDATAVNSILAQLVANGNQTYGDLTVDITGNAAPTGQGLVDKATLEGWGWTVDVDAGGATAPVLVPESCTPADNGTGIAVDTTITALFNQAIAAGSGNFVLHDTGGVVETWPVASGVISGSGITFTLSSPMTNAEGHYMTIEAGAVVGAVGGLGCAATTDPTAWNWTTVSADVPVPVVVQDGYTPTDNATGVSPSVTFSLEFNVAVTAGVGDIVIYDSTPTEVDRIAASTVSGLGTTVVSWTSTELLNSADYSIQIDNTAFKNSEDEYYAGIADYTTWNFTTAAASSVLFFDDYNRADGDPGAEYALYKSATHTIINSKYVRTDTGDYRISVCHCGGSLPADYRLTISFPHSRVSAQYWGIALRVVDTAGVLSGPRVMFLTGSNPVPGNVWSYTDNPYTLNVTGGFPASWSVEQDHTMSLSAIGDTITLYFDGYEYGWFTAAVNNQANTWVAVVGQGDNRTWDDLTIEAVS